MIHWNNRTGYGAPFTITRKDGTVVTWGPAEWTIPGLKSKIKSCLHRGGEKVKKILIGLGVLAIAFAVYAAEPVLHGYKATLANVSLTGAYTQIDSLVVVSTDTSATILTVSGTALLEPLQHLYIGMGNDSANRTSATDLSPNNNFQEWDFTAAGVPTQDGYVKMPFSCTYVHTLATQTDITDTIYVNMKVSGYNYATGKNDVATIEDFLFLGNLTGN